MSPNLKQYLPTIGLVVASALGFLSVALTDNQLTLEETLNLGVIVLNAMATYVVPRLEGVTWLKRVVAVGLAILQALIAYLTSGISASEWVLVVLAGLGALGVVVTDKYVPVMPRRPQLPTRQ